MKRWMSLRVMVFVVTIFLPIGLAYAQSPKKAPLPQVPITYGGDTDKTIIRRAQWIEGAKKEGTVSWWGSLKPNDAQELITAFNTIYPFIKVNYWRGGDKERNTRIETEHSIGRLSVDVSEPADFTTSYPRWRANGLVEEYTDFIPGLSSMDKRLYSKHGDWAQIGNNVLVPMYNTNLVSSAEAPKSWEDFLHPKWKGKIGLTTDIKAWYTLALDEKGWGLEKTENFLKKLKQQGPIWAAGHSAGYSLLMAGEYSLMGENYLRYLFDSKKKAVPVNWVRAQPLVVTGGTFLLTKKGPHPNAARLFIEWLFSPNAAPLYEKVTGYGAAFPGSGTMTSKALEGLSLVYRSEEVVAKASEMKLVEKYAGILGVTPE